MEVQVNIIICGLLNNNVMVIKYQIVKKREDEVGEPILLYPTPIGDGIYEYDTIEECQSKIDSIIGFSIYDNVILTIKEVYYE